MIPFETVVQALRICSIPVMARAAAVVARAAGKCVFVNPCSELSATPGSSVHYGEEVRQAGGRCLGAANMFFFNGLLVQSLRVEAMQGQFSGACDQFGKMRANAHSRAQHSSAAARFGGNECCGSYPLHSRELLGSRVRYTLQ